MLFIRPDPAHSWYAAFTTCQTLRMWTTLFLKCTSESDRVLALRALVYFAQPPDKHELPRREDYTKEMAFRDLIREEQQQGSSVTLEQFMKPRKRKTDGEPKKPKPNSEHRVNMRLEIPERYRRAAKERMMKYRKDIKRQQQEMDVYPDEGPIDVYENCLYSDEDMYVYQGSYNYRNIVQEAILACVFWQKFSAEDPREKCRDLGKRSLMSSFHKFFMYEDGSIYPVLYDESCMMRRAMVSSIALLRDKEVYERMNSNL